MNLTKLRIQLAVALGLPLVACKTGGPVEGPAPAGGAVAGATSGKRCAVDQVHEFVCGLTDKDSPVPKVGAAPPYEACGVNAIPLAQFDDFLFIDSSKWGNHDPGLSTFRYDAERTKKYHYGGTISEGDTWCCYERCEPLPISKTPRTSVPAGMTEHERCVPPPETGPSRPAAAAKQCPAGLKLTIEWGENATKVPLDDAPFKHVGDQGACCYGVASKRKCDTDLFEGEDGKCHHPERGRPLREGGVPVVARTVERGGWSVDANDTPGSAYAAAAWAREAAAEHASIAAFARLALDLMRLGAPSELVDEAHVAARDEIRHARLAYGLASAFGGTAVGPGRLAIGAGGEATLEALASECFRDGCVGETVAAMAAAEARDRALPGAVRDALTEIAEDEARHATLSYRILAWALTEGGAPVRDRIAVDLAALRAEEPAPPAADPAGFDERLGVLANRTAAAVRRRVLADVVVPYTEALLA